MPLRLVHPRTDGQGSRPRSRRKSRALYPTREEVDRIRAALRNLRRAYGGADVLAAVMGVSPQAIQNAISRRQTSYAIAVLAARAAGTTVEQLLGGPAVAGRCALCGRKGAP